MPDACPLAWDDIRLVAAIAAAGTLPAAAKHLGLDHSTVFRRLRRIDDALGTPAFERGRAGYNPTEAGAEIAALAARIEEDRDAVLRRVAGRAPSPAGEVRIATSDALLSGLLLPLLAEFGAACPDVRLDFVTGNTALNLSRRDADVAIRATNSPPDTLVGRRVARIAWAPYAATPHDAPPADDAAPFAADAPWVGFGDALSGLAAAAHLRAHLPEERRIAARFDTVGGLVAGVEAGLGRGLLPCFAAARRPALARLAPPIDTLATDLWLLTHPDLRQVPRVRVLLDFLAERLAALRPAIEGLAPPS
ncbi:MAG: LysR family transcriptional regulator [Janthinobacterium lividum]